ncbi:PadR family transcriptional regulator [Actinomyces polynesiensis]|uniref:PadR family transcriptional regulator n=1 Tax=Actinomyces polynesiensis TaxID=1325934 RepID=UPI0005BE9271|nr:PadR family transcriptional regulator [Actinomyces polynesiensis]
MSDQWSTHVQELRRGTVVLAALLALREPEYGYALIDRLHGVGLDIEANTLYPLLRRLESQGLLTSSWNTEDTRPRKFYTTSPSGSDLAATLLEEWHSLSDSLSALTTEPEGS